RAAGFGCAKKPQKLPTSQEAIYCGQKPRRAPPGSVRRRHQRFDALACRFHRRTIDYVEMERGQIDAVIALGVDRNGVTEPRIGQQVLRDRADENLVVAPITVGIEFDALMERAN